MPASKARRHGILYHLGRLIAILFLSSLGYVLICKWLMPPVTITQLSSLVSGYGLHRSYVPWGQIPRNVKLAAIASEDQLFAEHNGFDWHAIDKSLHTANAKRHRHKKIAGAGASTISQQTAKNVFLWQGSGAGRYIRKLPEFYFTKLIEWTWGKKRILEVYLNVIEMGKGIFGIEEASMAYFQKPARNLSRTEAAMIIACLPNPRVYTVVPLSRWVRWRYKHILDQMDNLDGDDDIDALLN